MTGTNERRANRRRGTAGTLSRRRVLGAMAAVGATAGVSRLGSAQETTSYRLGGRVDGWQGQSPSEIEGDTNPVLELRIDTEYEITWENLDGAPHNIAILDSEGNALQATENVSEQGATQTITFTATSETTQYVCQVHPNEMIGDINVGGAAGQTVGENVTSLPEGTQTTGKAAPTDGGGGAQETTVEETPTEDATPATTTVVGPGETTVDEEGTPEPGEAEQTGNDGGQPGFGVVGALAAVLGGAYLRYREADE